MRLAVRAVRVSLRASGPGSTLYRTPVASIVRAAPRTALPHSRWCPTLSTSSIQSSRHFSTTIIGRDEATATLLKEEPVEEVSVETQPERKIPERDSSFASLKPHISYPTFKSLTVKPFGYKDMSDVQERVLHLLPELADPAMTPMSDGQGGRDLLVKAKTGTGKTIAFLVPAIERRVKHIHQTERGHFSESWEKMLLKNRPDFNFESLDKHGRTALARQFATNTVGTLVISPTRELATQIANEAVKLHHFHEKYSVQLLVGGASKQAQLRDWRRGRPDVVVATPGRLLDLIESEPMVGEAISATQTLILDEADTLLEMGFRDEIKKVVDHLPPSSQRATMLFSATVSKDIREISRKSLSRDHRYIDCVPAGEDNVHKHIPQFATVLDNIGDQLVHVARLIALDQMQNAGKSKVIIFAPTTRMVQLLADIFTSPAIRNALPAGVKTQMYEIHSKKDQSVRFRTSDRFRQDKSGASVLLTSDVSARGVDYPGTTRVIQVGAPSSKDQYIHRIGRTGRAGASGRANIILLPSEAGFYQFSLNDLPLQESSVSQVEAELREIATKFDEDPTSVVDADVWNQMNQAGGAGGSRRGPRGQRSSSSMGVSPLRQPLLPKLSGIAEAVQDSVGQLDEEAVRETFFSLLGFYMGHFQELRTDKMTLADGLKQWAVQAGGLETEPYISANMMEKLGIRSGGGGGRGGFGSSRGGSSRYGGDGNFGDRNGSRGSRFGRGAGGGGSYGGRGGYSDSRSDGRGGYGDSRGSRDDSSRGRFNADRGERRSGPRGGLQSEFSSADRF